MLYSKSQSLNVWVAVAVGSLAMGQFTAAQANPKPMQQPEAGIDQPIRSTTPNRTNQLMQNTQNDGMNQTDSADQTNPNITPGPTQSDGTNQVNPTDRMIRNNGNSQTEQSDQNDQNQQMYRTNQTNPNIDPRPTQSDGTNQVNPTDRMIRNNGNSQTEGSTQSK